ncbi:MAG: sugar phosphate isomerase/epimerase family protein [Kiritimatiellia bacterium]
MMNRRMFLGSGALAMLAAGCCSVPATCCPEKKGRKVPFKLGMAGYSCVRLDIDRTLALLKKLDLHYLCIKDFHLPFNSKPEKIAEFHRKCADHGVTGYAVGPIYMKRDEARRYFDYAKAVGVKTVVAVPYENGQVNGKPQRCASRACCEVLSGLCGEYDLRVAIHNHGPDIPYCYPTGDAAFEMVRDLDPRMGLCLDIGHNFRAGLDPAVSIRKLHTRLFDLHLKNVAYDPKRNLPRPMPRGDMDLWEVANALVDVNYTGCCSLEYESFPKKPAKGEFDVGVHESEIAESIGYFKGIMKAIEG